MDRLDRNAARKLITRVRAHGAVIIWGHCRDRMRERDLDAADIDNVLRCGIIHAEPEFEKNAWRYRVETHKMIVVIQFDSEERLSVVTAMRKGS